MKRAWMCLLLVLSLTVLLAVPAMAADTHTDHCVCNGTQADTEGHTCESVDYTEVTAQQFLSTAYWTAVTDGSNTEYNLTADANLCLTEDVTLSTEYRLKGYTLNLCLNGHTVTMEGTNARITSNTDGNTTAGVLNITDCGTGGSITASENGCKSGMLYTYKGSVNIYGGTVDASACNAGSGGAVYVGADSDSFTLYGGTVIGSKKGTNGGAIFTPNKVAKAVVTIAGGTVKDGYASTNGGNIYITSGTLNVTGGTITGGEAAGGTGGIYLAWNSKCLNLSGDALIYDNEGADVCRSNNTAAGYSEIFVNGWSGNGEENALCVSRVDGAAGSVLVSGNDLTAADLAHIASADDTLGVALSGGQLICKPLHTHCVCNGTLKDTKGHTCVDVDFVQVTAEEFLACFDSNTLAGNFGLCLTETVTLSEEYSLGSYTLNLCLNGHTVTMKDDGRITANGGDLNLSDCSENETGKIMADASAANGFVFVQNGTVTLYGGTIDGTAVNTTANGGAVYVNLAAASFVMNSGKVMGGTANYGGAVFVNQGSFVMNDGEIVGGTAKRGGGVYLHDTGSTFTMNGGRIHSGTADLGGNVGLNKAESFTMNGGQIYRGTVTGTDATGANVNIGWSVTGAVTLSGDAKIYGGIDGADLHLGQNPANEKNYLTLNNWSGNGEGYAVMTVSRRSDTEITVVAVPGANTALTYGDKAKLASYSADHQVVFTGTDLELVDGHYHCICNGTLAGTEGHTCVDVKFDEVTSLATLTADANYYLDGTVTLSSEVTTAGYTLNLCLNGQTLEMSGNGRITANRNANTLVHGQLNITDCGTNGSITGVSGCRQSVVYTYRGNADLYSGSINAAAISGTTDKQGGAVTVGYDGDVFTMHGGAITGGSIVNGGAVHVVAGAQLDVKGGTITGGSATSGGAVYSAGTVNISGGTVTGGEATNGGNLYIAGGSVTISGKDTLITGGNSKGASKAANGGGNIYITAGEVTVSGGTITKGTATANGGNIMLYENSTEPVLNIIGGTVSEGTANGTASGNGGGNINVGGKNTGKAFPKVNISGGTVSAGTANTAAATGGDGGNINMNRGTLTVSGGTITGGNAANNGDGIYLGYNAKALALSGSALIYGNGDCDISMSTGSANYVALGDWAGNGTNGALKIAGLSTSMSYALVKPDANVTIDLALFTSADSAYQLVVSNGNVIRKTAE